MKKRLLLLLALVSIFVFALALSVAAAPQNYYSYEAELTNGDVITIYQAGGAWDQWQGRAYISDTMYTEPPVDSDGTYATLDWSSVKVLDFTNAWGHIYNSQLGVHEQKIGTNDGGSVHLVKSDFTPAKLVNVEKIITGKVTAIIGSALGSLPALKELVISKNLKSLSYNCFEYCTKLTTITIDDDAKFALGNQIFKGCSSLTTVDFLDRVTSIGDSVFDGCSSLTSVVWPEKYTKIPNGTFANCTSLVFEIPSFIKIIGGGAFNNCDSLVSVTIPDGVTQLGNAFGYCDNLEEIIITENSQITNKIIALAEYCPKLKSIRIPPLVTELGYDNFRGCTSLSEIIWPNNLIKIAGGQNFTNIAIKSLTLPNTLVSMEGGNVSGLEEIRLGESLTNLGSGIFAYKSIKKVYLPSTITTVDSRILGYSNPADSSLNITFIFTGTREQAIALQELVRTAAQGTGREPNASKLYDAILVSADEYDVTQEPSGYHLVYGYSACDAFHASEHEMSGDATMQFDGFFNDITFAYTCTRKDCGNTVLDESKTIGAMFTYLGYSYTESAIGGKYSMSQFYGINKSNVQKYTDLTNAPFSLGIVVSSVDNPIGSEFEGTNRVVTVSLSNLIHDYFDVKVTNMKEEHLNSAIVFCAYVNDNGTVYYLDNNDTTQEIEGKSYETIKSLENAKPIK